MLKQIEVFVDKMCILFFLYHFDMAWTSCTQMVSNYYSPLISCNNVVLSLKYFWKYSLIGGYFAYAGWQIVYQPFYFNFKTVLLQHKWFWGMLNEYLYSTSLMCSRDGHIYYVSLLFLESQDLQKHKNTRLKLFLWQESFQARSNNLLLLLVI